MLPTEETLITNTQCVTETTHLSHFRGRKLLGRTLPLPENYIGVIIDPSTATSQVGYHDDEDVDDIDAEDRDEKPKECKVLGEFKEIMVWGHEELPEGNEGIWKGVGEWMGLAETVRWNSELRIAVSLNFFSWLGAFADSSLGCDRCMKSMMLTMRRQSKLEQKYIPLRRKGSWSG